MKPDIFSCLQCFSHINRLFRAHFLAAEAGNTALFPEFRLFILNADDARRTAFRAFSAAHAELWIHLRVGFQEAGSHEDEGFPQKARHVSGKIQADGIRLFKGCETSRNRIAHKLKLIRFREAFFHGLADHDDLHGIKAHEACCKIVLGPDIPGSQKKI